MAEQSAAATNVQSSRISFRAVFLAALIAGGGFLLLEYIVSAVGIPTPLGPSETIPAVIGTEGTGGLSFLIVLVHFGVSLFTTMVLGLVVHRMPLHLAAALGTVYGAILYVISFLILVSVPGLSLAASALIALIYAAYGGLAGALYKALQ